MYRALTYAALTKQVDIEHEREVADVLSSVKIDLIPTEQGQIVLMNDENVTEVIRMSEVTNNVSIVARHAMIREEMVKRQRELASSGGVVMDGRDIGTHVLPEAELKVFLQSNSRGKSEKKT